MDTKAVVTIVVAILVLVVVAIPVIGGATFYESASNESESRFSAYKGETLDFSYSDATLSLNGDAVSGVVLISEQFIVAVPDVYHFAGASIYSWADGDSLTISNGAVSGTGTFAAVTGSVGSDCIYSDPDGDIGRFSSGTSFNTNLSTKLYLVVNYGPAYLSVGSISGGFDTIRSANIVSSSVVDVPISSVEVDSTAVGDSSERVVTGATITLGDGTSKDAVIYAPLSYLTPSDGGTTADLIGVIPILIAVGILLGAVALIRRY